MQAHPGRIHVIQKSFELARRDQEALFGATAFAANPYLGARSCFAELLDVIDGAPIDLVIRRVLGDEAGDDKNRVRAQNISGLDLTSDVVSGFVAKGGIARGEGRVPIECVRDVGDYQSRVFHLAAQFAHLGVGMSN